MKWPLVKALLWALVVFLHIREHKGCFEEERIGLLKLKAFLKSNTHEDNLLLSWVDNTKSDCCGWERVTCNSTTGRAIKLSLAQVTHPEYDPYTSCKDRWLLNVSLFMSFTELRSLDLSSNYIGGCLPNEGFEKLSNLKSLRNLDLQYNCLGNNGLSQSLGEVTSLETINLTSNYFDGQFSTQGSKMLLGLENLETLDLSLNFFNNTSIIELLSSAKSIKNLNLAGNGMSGYISAQGSKSLLGLENLEMLDLSLNCFNNISIIELLSSAKSIKSLNLAGNDMSGYFSAQGSKSLLGLENLETLDLSLNFFNNTSIIELLSSAKSIKSLNLAGNGMSGYFSAQGSKSLLGLENLDTLDLSYNFFNDTSIIELLSSAKSIKSLNLAGNGMSGYFPAQGLANLSRLEILHLEDNEFTGSIPLHIRALSSLKAMSLARNLFNGTLSQD